MSNNVFHFVSVGYEGLYGHFIFYCRTGMGGFPGSPVVFEKLSYTIICTIFEALSLISHINKPGGPQSIYTVLDFSTPHSWLTLHSSSNLLGNCGEERNGLQYWPSATVQIKLTVPCMKWKHTMERLGY